MIPQNSISQLKDRGAASRSKPGGRGSKAVAGAKGAAAEGGALHPLPGQTEKIRLTVAYAERYELIAMLSPSPGPGVMGERFGRPGSCAKAQAALSVCASHCFTKGENEL
jgi:hypothetical protein